MSEIKVINMNDGTKIAYEIFGNKIIFNDELMLNLEKYERDDDIHIDVCMDEFGCLCMGLARNYVAQIDIPARKYNFVENGKDEQNNPKFDKVAVPFNMENVIITLWEVE